jgi:hypothetical protein
VTRWRWFVQGYYANDVKPPKVAGELAIEIGGVSREALAMDVDILERRADIGEIVGPFEATQ